MIVQGNNINHLKNLKNYKNEGLNIQIKSPNNINSNNLQNPSLNETSENKKKISVIKSESITNSNMNTNPSTIHKSDSLTHNFQNYQIFSKDKSTTNVKFRYLIQVVSVKRNNTNNQKNNDLEDHSKNEESEDKESSRREKEKSIDLILSPNNEKIYSINDLKKKYKLSDEIKNIVNERLPLIDKINEQSYDNSSERNNNNNSKSINFNISGASKIGKKYSKDKLIPINNNVKIKINDEKTSSNKNINININNNTNIIMINDNKESSDNYTSLDSKTLKSILKKKPSDLKIEIPPLNLNKNIGKAIKRVSIEDEILPTCLKTKSLSILSLSNIKIKVN